MEKKTHFNVFLFWLRTFENCNHCRYAFSEAIGLRKLMYKGEEKPKTCKERKSEAGWCVMIGALTLALTQLPPFISTYHPTISTTTLFTWNTWMKPSKPTKTFFGLPVDFMCFDWRPWAASFRHLLGWGHPKPPSWGGYAQGAWVPYCTPNNWNHFSALSEFTWHKKERLWYPSLGCNAMYSYCSAVHCSLLQCTAAK